jgi:hypothetical protein
MTKLKVKDIRNLITNLPDDTDFEIDISNGKIGERSISTDIRHKGQIQMGCLNKDRNAFGRLLLNATLMRSETKNKGEENDSSN